MGGCLCVLDAPAPRMFDAIATRSRSPSRRRLPFLAAAAAVYAGAVALALVLTARRGVASEAVVPVRIVAPRAPAIGPPPAPSRPAPVKPAQRPTAVRKLIQPREAPEAPVVAPEEPEVEPEEESIASEADGVVGGAPGAEGGALPSLAPPEPAPARPADLASVRAAIGRTLVYPPLAKRHGWRGKVVLAFVMSARGAVDELVVQAPSGFKVLDEAAVAAIRAASPFPPPGIDVRVVIPLVFDVHE